MSIWEETPKATRVGPPKNVVVSPHFPCRSNMNSRKLEFQRLNDRLACYIDRVRRLETENIDLKAEIKSAQDSMTIDSTHIKSLIKNELKEAKKMTETVRIEKKKLELENIRLREKNENLMKSEEKLRFNTETAQKFVDSYKKQFNESFENAQQLQISLSRIKKENNCLNQFVEDLHAKLDQMNLKNEQLGNTVESLKDELSLKQSIISHEFSNNSSRGVLSNSKETQLVNKCDNNLQETLIKFREDLTKQYQSNLNESRQLYENELKNLKDDINRYSKKVQRLNKEIFVLTHKQKSLYEKINQLESINNNLNTDLNNLDREMQAKRLKYRDELNYKDVEIEKLRSEMAQQLIKYQELMELKNSLDFEMVAYNMMLCNEDDRINLYKPIMDSTSLPAGGVAIKRRRIECSSTPKISPCQAITLNSNHILNSSPIPSPSSISHIEKKGILERIFGRSSIENSLELIEAITEQRILKFRNKTENSCTINIWQLLHLIENKKIVNDFCGAIKVEAGETLLIGEIVNPAKSSFVEKKYFFKAFNSDGGETSQNSQNSPNSQNSQNSQNSTKSKDTKLGETITGNDGEALIINDQTININDDSCRSSEFEHEAENEIGTDNDDEKLSAKERSSPCTIS